MSAIDSAKEQPANPVKGEGKQEEAAFPALGIPESAGHKGVIAVAGDRPIEVLILTFKALTEFAEKLASRIYEAGTKAVLICNDSDMEAMAALQSFVIRSRVLETSLENLADEADQALGTLKADSFTIAAAVTAAGAAINSGLQLLSLFRVDHKVQGSTVAVEDGVLATSVAGELSRRHVQVCHTALCPIPVADANSPVVNSALAALQSLRARLSSARGKLKGSETGEPLKGPAPEADQAEEDLKARIEAGIAEIDTFQAALAKADDKGNMSALSQLVTAERLMRFLDKPAEILRLKVLGAGGTSHGRESTTWADLRFSGGAVVSFARLDKHGGLLEADTVPAYSGCEATSFEDREFAASFDAKSS